MQRGVEQEHEGAYAPGDYRAATLTLETPSTTEEINL